MIRLNGTGSDPDGSISSFRWTQVQGPTVVIGAPDVAVTTSAAPLSPSEITLVFRLAVTDNHGATSQDEVRVVVDPNLTQCMPSAPPPGLGLNTFYQKYCDANGLPVVSSAVVPDLALQWVWYQTRQMTSMRPDVVDAMVRSGTRVAVMAQTEVTTDIPEHADLYSAFPGTDWNARARGLGATPQRPASSAAEENVLCYASDRYRGELINVHEFAHSMDIMGLRQVDPTWATRLQATYAAAMTAGLWINTYAAANKEEYWAEGVQSWFNTNIEAIPTNGIHNQVNTRAELAAYDPALYQMISEVMPENWQPSCPLGAWTS